MKNKIDWRENDPEGHDKFPSVCRNKILYFWKVYVPFFDDITGKLLDTIAAAGNYRVFSR